MPHIAASSASVPACLSRPLSSISLGKYPGCDRTWAYRLRYRSSKISQQGTARLVLSRSYMALPTSMYEFDSFTNRRPSAST